MRAHESTSPILLCGLIGALLGVSSGGQLAAQQCPLALLDGERAYFGSNLSANVCSQPGATCEATWLLAEQRFAATVCDAGRWVVDDQAGSAALASCPRAVFDALEIWANGSYQPNTCQAATAPLCQSTFFRRLPGGGSGFRPAACRNGRWQPEPLPSEAPPYRLRRAASGSELVSYLRQGLVATYTGQSPFAFGPAPTGGPAGGPSSGGGTDAPLSRTNVQEAGVDEEDRIKSDGAFLYVLNNHQSVRQQAAPSFAPQVRILELNAAAPSARHLTTFELDLDDHEAPSGLYLREEADQLLVTASSLALDWYYWYSPLAWLEATSSVVSVDVSDPARPRQTEILELDGQIVSSRRIDDVVYLATRFQPYLPGLGFYDPADPGSTGDRQIIEGADLDDLLPSYRTSSDPGWRALVAPHDCYLPADGAPVHAADVITLVAIDLDSMDVRSSRCFVGATETLYVSLDSIYVASTRYDYRVVQGTDGAPWIQYDEPEVETDLHKFSLGEGAISYQASGVVDGHLGFNITRRPFRLSEKDDDLRAITYTDELTADRSPVAVTVLRQGVSDRLEVVGRLPNARRPAPIGKPGELLYATRFVGDRAYLVTFLVTDPLYVVDLSRPEDPYVAGELEITGYSDYLHPIGQDHVLGVGKDAVPDPSGDFRGAWYQGLKVSLYDVRDPTRPIEVDSLVLGKRGSESPVLHDHRAFTYLEPPGQAPRIAMGSVIHERWNATTPPKHPSDWYDWSFSGLQLFEIDTTAGRLRKSGEMRVESYGPSGRTHPIFGDDRSVLVGDAIFYVHGDDVYTALWSDPSSFEGPE